MEYESRGAQAEALFKAGFNCSQAVTTVFCEAYGADSQMVGRLATGMGGGFRSGNICGALSGAILIAGLKHGAASPDDKAAKMLCYAKTTELLDAFRALHGTCLCREILGCDLSTPEGWKQAQPLFGTVCPGVIRSAVELLEKHGY